MKTKPNILIIHHSADLDGLTSGTIATKLFEIFKELSPLEFTHQVIGYNYGKNPEIDTWLKSSENQYTHYQFIDITPPLFWLELNQDRILTGEIKISIFDHHQSAYNDIRNLLPLVFKSHNFEYYFDVKYCGAFIYHEMTCGMPSIWIRNIFGNNAYDLFNKQIKKYFETYEFLDLVSLVDSYDTWKWKTNYESPYYLALAVNEYFLQFKTVQEYYKIIFAEDFNIKNVINIGLEIINFKIKQAKLNKHLICNIYDVTVCIVNNIANIYDIDIITEKQKLGFNQELSGKNHNAELEVYSKVKCILFYNNIDFINDKINLSLRALGNKNNFDCNKFVKRITNNNGGGHFAASGGSMLLSEFNKLIENSNSFFDKNGIKLKNGDIININQTVNGVNLFAVLDVNINNLDIRYLHDFEYKYQYDMLDLISPNKLNGDIEFEIVGNVSNQITIDSFKIK